MQLSPSHQRQARRGAAVVAAALSTVLLATLAAPANAQGTEVETPVLTVADGVTQPVFGYDDAIREKVFVTSDVDSDSDGVLDVVAFDIMRPAATEDGHLAPVIMDASPYYATVGRGNEAERKVDSDGDGLLDQWPLYYDNYFVPRGYAVMLLDMIGTGSSTGCPTTGGVADNVSAVAAIDWLNGRRPGRDADGNAVVADWHNGSTGMIGKSYDGTLANAAAATGVEGLETVVPISAISNWYLYSRSNGIRFNTNYPGSLSNTVTTPSRRAYCAPVRTWLNENDGDESGDYTPFWHERNYLPDADKVTASVFVVHGINDWNVKTDHLIQWWDLLAENDVERKLWLTGTGHIDPFDFRREEWVDTLHRWFDHELFDIDNGIMDEPMVDIERNPDEWETHPTWPLADAAPVDVFLRPGADNGTGSLGTTPGRGAAWSTFTDRPSTSRNQAIAPPAAAEPNRLVYRSAPLTAPLHISGSPYVTLQAKVNDVDTNFAAVLVDYGTRERFSTSGDGIRTLGADSETCWGLSSAADDACYRETEKTLASNPQEMVTQGIQDALNLDSITEATPLVPGAENRFDFELLPEDYVFETGHRIGVVLLGSYSGYSSVADQNRAEISIGAPRSSITLPVVGGRAAARAAGLR
ncbi:Xaa-Pro dipeptidyl-peptidase [Aquipuribacter sp. MA13-6]|uniref:Xaa-Pro dipeptidyl-peptidase n=1 Tax=unclassified Aquipuribacter TaxID=2635084 RepID=UPI003EE9A3AB